MASGTFIRILIGLLILFSPFVCVYYTGNLNYWHLLWLYIYFPMAIAWEKDCTCSNCIFSSRCDEEKRFKFIKNLFVFVGFNKQIIDNIKLTYDVENTYIGMYHYIKDSYERICNM